MNFVILENMASFFLQVIINLSFAVICLNRFWACFKNTFILDQIVPSGEETFAAVKSMVKDVMAYHKVEGFAEEKRNPIKGI